MTKLSPHFSKDEMACHCCGDLKVDERLLSGLETLRKLAGAPVIVHDAYRCPKHNEESGGVADSEHTRGLAADVRISGLSLQQMYGLALQVPEFANGGIGAYDGGFLHVDVRSHSSRWARVRGQYVGIQHLVEEPVLLAQKADLGRSG
jgi:uncharacterized protein YcbK (DUF882 family)